MTPLSPGHCPSCLALESSIRALTAQNIDALTRAAALDDELRSLKKTLRHTHNSSISDNDEGPTRRDSARGRSAEESAWQTRRAVELESARQRSVERAREELVRERALRVEAEKHASKLGEEMEDLSVRLFEEANGMVASEREARARLEERVGVLEAREKARGRRLERIEGAVARLERVRRMLGDA